MSKEGFKREMIAAESYLKDLDYLHIKNNAQLKLVGVVNCISLLEKSSMSAYDLQIRRKDCNFLRACLSMVLL